MVLSAEAMACFLPFILPLLLEEPRRFGSNSGFAINFRPCACVIIISMVAIRHVMRNDRPRHHRHPFPSSSSVSRSVKRAARV
jgi:hypothetical protein